MLLLARYARSAAITNMNALYRLHLYYLQKIDYLLSRYVTLAIFSNSNIAGEQLMI